MRGGRDPQQSKLLRMFAQIEGRIFTSMPILPFLMGPLERFERDDLAVCPFRQSFTHGQVRVFCKMPVEQRFDVLHVRKRTFRGDAQDHRGLRLVAGQNQAALHVLLVPEYVLETQAIGILDIYPVFLAVADGQEDLIKSLDPADPLHQMLEDRLMAEQLQRLGIQARRTVPAGEGRNESRGHAQFLQTEGNSLMRVSRRSRDARFRASASTRALRPPRISSSGTHSRRRHFVKCSISWMNIVFRSVLMLSWNT